MKFRSLIIRKKLIQSFNNNIFDYKSNGLGVGYKFYFRRDKLTQELIPNNELKLRFVINLFESKPNAVIDNRVIDDYKKLVNRKELSDFVLIVGNRELFPQKSILSDRSKVFKAMFANDMIESHSNRELDSLSTASLSTAGLSTDRFIDSQFIDRPFYRQPVYRQPVLSTPSLSTDRFIDTQFNNDISI